MDPTTSRPDPRRGRPDRRRGLLPLLLVALAICVAMPAQALAATSPVRLHEGDQRNAWVSRWALDPEIRVHDHPAEQPLLRRNGVLVYRFLQILAAEQAIEAARIAAEKAAAAAAAKAAAEKAAAAKAAAEKAAKPTYAGKNHLWIPSLGVNRNVEWFACDRATPPANYVYRWGCAGSNNAYLFGHAWGVFKPLHDAYVNGKLKKGMVVVYADPKGVVRTYRLTEIRVVTPDQVSWAIAAQSRPSLTLQTCVGAKSEKRLLVRLVADG